MLESPKILSYFLGSISLGASIYAASLFGSGQSLERYWWGAVGLGFGSWCIYENKQAIQEQWEDDVLLDADRQVFLHRQSAVMQKVMVPAAPQPQMMSLPPVNLSPEVAEGTIDGLVRDKKSTILSAIPGTTKTTLSMAYLWKLHEIFPQAEVYVACVKNDRFLGLAELPGKCLPLRRETFSGG